MRYFISGHRDLTIKEFEEHYIPLIQKVVEEDIYADFIVGDWEGCDTQFLEWLLCTRPNNSIVEIYCVNFPRVKIDNVSIINFENVFFTTKNTYDECDASMTKDSDFDIAWIRPGRENSHTANNIKRRYNL